MVVVCSNDVVLGLATAFACGFVSTGLSTRRCCIGCRRIVWWSLRRFSQVLMALMLKLRELFMLLCCP